MTRRPWAVREAEALLALAKMPSDDRAAYLIRHGTMRVGLYAPRDIDTQTPHDQDELYIVASGEGLFTREGETITVSRGDLLFVAAAEAHVFHEFSEDFSTWVVFWGPKGGEN